MVGHAGLSTNPGELAELRAHIDRIRGRTTRVHPKFADETPNPSSRATSRSEVLIPACAAAKP